MRIEQINNPEGYLPFLERASMNVLELFPKIQEMSNQIREGLDKSVLAYTKQFDQVELEDMRVSPSEIKEAIEAVPDTLKVAIGHAKDNIEAFHRKQESSAYNVEQIPGLSCSRKTFAIDAVGLYIPGGSAPLFSTVLMLAVPSEIAGNETRVLCTPPNKEGKVHPAILYTAHLCGINRIFKVGGAQAVIAMANGTETIPKVNKIFGPGNAYVTAAKQYVNLQGTAIDMPAGPSEVLVIADDEANPAFVASDLLSQAEHGPDSQVVLCAKSVAFCEKVAKELENQLSLLPRKEIAKQALENSFSLVFESDSLMIEYVNAYAPEHLIIQTEEASELSKYIRNAGSIFIGAFTPESLGDYASGTNHTLPTAGWAASTSGLNVDSFRKSITYQSASANALKVMGPIVETMATAEMLHAHAKAVTIRLDSLKEYDDN